MPLSLPLALLAATALAQTPEQSAAPPTTEPRPEAEAPPSVPADDDAGADLGGQSNAPPAAPEAPMDEDGWGEDDAFGDGEGDGWGAGDAGDAFESLEQSIATIEEQAEAEEAPHGSLSVGGFLRHRSGLWVEGVEGRPAWAQSRNSFDASLRYKRPLSLLGLDLSYRLVGDIHFEHDLAYQYDPDDFYDRATRDLYEDRVIGGETFVALAYGPLELTFGRQIVAWGQGDMFSPLDVVNPRDLREPGLAELDDVRVAVLASTVGLFVGAHRVEVMAIHETNFGLRPAPLSSYSPLRKLLGDQPGLAAQLGDVDLRYAHDPDGIALDRRTQWLGRWQYAGAGLDLALYGGRTLDRQGVFGLPTDLPDQIASGHVALPLQHKPYWMLGHAGAKPSGDFVFKWEVGFDFARPLMAQRAAGPLTPVAVRSGQLNWLAGATYAGITDGTLAFEYSQSVLIDHPERSGDRDLSLLFPVEQPSFGVLFNQTYLRETLSLRVSMAAFGLTRFLGVLGRAEIGYVLRDALEVGLGYVTYQPSADNIGPLYGFEDNDRLYATLRYDFLLD